MKKIVSLLLCAMLLFACVGCGGSTENKPSALKYAGALKEAGFPMENLLEYTEENDPNGLLGRPGEYISKVNWADSRVEQYESTDPLGGIIETFSSKSDMEKRKQYIESVGDMFALGKEYLYPSPDGFALMRIAYDLTPEAAEAYKVAFEEFCTNGEIKSVYVDTFDGEGYKEKIADGVAAIEESGIKLSNVGRYEYNYIESYMKLDARSAPPSLDSILEYADEWIQEKAKSSFDDIQKEHEEILKQKEEIALIQVTGEYADLYEKYEKIVSAYDSLYELVIEYPDLIYLEVDHFNEYNHSLDTGINTLKTLTKK